MKVKDLKDRNNLTNHQYKILMFALAFYEANKKHESISCVLHSREKYERSKRQKKDNYDRTINENTIVNLAFFTAFLMHDNDVKKIMQRFGINIDKLRTNISLDMPRYGNDSYKELEQIEIPQAFLDVVDGGIFTNESPYSTIGELITNIKSDVPRFFEIFSPSTGKTNESIESLMSLFTNTSDGDIMKNANLDTRPSYGKNSQTTSDSGLNKKSENRLETVTIEIVDPVNLRRYPFPMIDETSANYEENPAIGREDIIKKVAIDLCMRDQSVILTGHPGVGKTTIVKGLAYSIKTGVFPGLKDYKILSTTSTDLESGTMYVGSLDTKMNSIIEFLRKGKNILFIDEIHQLVGAGASSSNSKDIAGILSPHLSSGEIKLIGATTTSHYNQILGVGDFERRFSRTEVDEPKGNHLQSIIRHAFYTYGEEETIVEMSDEEIADISEKIANITEKKVNRKYDLQREGTYYRCNPDLSLSIIQRAFAIAKCFGTTVTKDTIIESILLNDLLTENAKNMAIEYINNFDSNSSEKPNKKILLFNPNRGKRNLRK